MSLVQEFDITQAVEASSVIPVSRLHIRHQFREVPIFRIQRGLVYFFAGWGPVSWMCFHQVTRALASRDVPGLEIYVVDIESVPHDFFRTTFGDHSGGVGEAIWIRDGAIIVTMMGRDLSKIESEVLRCVDLVSSPSS